MKVNFMQIDPVTFTELLPNQEITRDIEKMQTERRRHHD